MKKARAPTRERSKTGPKTRRHTWKCVTLSLPIEPVWRTRRCAAIPKAQTLKFKERAKASGRGDHGRCTRSQGRRVTSTPSWIVLSSPFAQTPHNTPWHRENRANPMPRPALSWPGLSYPLDGSILFRELRWSINRPKINSRAKDPWRFQPTVDNCKSISAATDAPIAHHKVSADSWTLKTLWCAEETTRTVGRTSDNHGTKKSQIH